MPFFNSPNLLDEAWKCINLSLQDRKIETIKKNFAKLDFVFGVQNMEERKKFWCQTHHVGSFDYFHRGRCLLCDWIAPLLLGVQLGDRWVFDSKFLAQQYLLLCVLLTTATTDYYLALHQRARKRFERAHRTAQEVSTASAGRNKQAEESNYFVIAFGGKEGCPDAETPFFYLIGNRMHKDGRHQHHRQAPLIAHDFCIALPDLGYYRRNFEADGSRKKGVRNVAADKGEALYFRPIKPLETIGR